MIIHVNKRGFGAPQILSLIIISIFGIIIIGASLINIAASSPTREAAYTEMAQARAHMVLHNLIQMPMANPPADLAGAMQDVTIGDFIASRDMKNSDDRKLLREEMAAILDKMDQPDLERFATYIIFLDTTKLFEPDKEDRYAGFDVDGVRSECSVDPKKDKERKSTASLAIPSPSGDHMLKLVYCWAKVGRE